MESRKPLTVNKLYHMKQQKTPITVVTAYDYPTARLAEEAGVDLILVGDSLGNVVLGYDSTIPVTLDDIIYHTRAVTRAARHTFIMADMPFFTYHGSLDKTLSHVARLMQEGLAHAVKLEGGAEIAETVEAIVRGGVPVVGHLGLTPQSVHQLSGYRIQGKRAIDAQRFLHDAQALVAAGVCCIVLELMTDELAGWLTAQLPVPTIGIGSGPHCDGQVLVFHDMFQYHAEAVPKKFIQTYGHMGEMIRTGFSRYIQDVKSRAFPGPDHTYHMNEEESAQFRLLNGQLPPANRTQHIDHSEHDAHHQKGGDTWKS